jgi:hypothetical protein
MTQPRFPWSKKEGSLPSSIVLPWTRTFDMFRPLIAIVNLSYIQLGHSIQVGLLDI